MCADFRSLNRQTRLDMFPIPRIHDLLDKLGKACVFSAVDLSFKSAKEYEPCARVK